MTEIPGGSTDRMTVSCANSKNRSITRLPNALVEYYRQWSESERTGPPFGPNESDITYLLVAGLYIASVRPVSSAFPVPADRYPRYHGRAPKASYLPDKARHPLRTHADTSSPAFTITRWNTIDRAGRLGESL